MFKVTKTPKKNFSFETLLFVKHGAFTTQFKVILVDDKTYRIEATTTNVKGEVVNVSSSELFFKNSVYAYSKSMLKKRFVNYAGEYFSKIVMFEVNDVFNYG